MEIILNQFFLNNSHLNKQTYNPVLAPHFLQINGQPYPYMGCAGRASVPTLLLLECLLCSWCLCTSLQQFCGLPLKCHNQDHLSCASATVWLQAVTEHFLRSIARQMHQMKQRKFFSSSICYHIYKYSSHKKHIFKNFSEIIFNT